MNPFVNPHKRSISLPHGCKNFLEAPAPSPRESAIFIRDFIHLVLQLAWEDGATEVVIGIPGPDKDQTPVRYKVADQWCDTAPFPTRIRPPVLNELMKEAGLAKSPYPREGILVTHLVGKAQAWRLRISELNGECVLTTINV